MIYLNEFDRFAAQWLRNLIDKNEIQRGEVDERSIKEVEPKTLEAFTQCHFFAGIGGWPLALRYAGWPEDRPVWTGSCPCQPYSSAGKRKGNDDERNLWPEFFRLIRQHHPPTIFGEQVASAIGHGWLDGISDDLEREGYAVGSSVLPACSVGAPHKRERLFWVANSTSDGRKGIQRKTETQVQENWSSKALDAWNGIGNPFENWRQLMAKPDVRRVADGVSSTVDIRPRLRAYGNAIIPQVAAVFIRAFMECEF